jgi:hypothetical protein
MSFKTLRVLLSLWIVVLLFSTGQVQPVKATSLQLAPPTKPILWSFWVVRFHFINDTLNFEWVLFYGDYDGNGDRRLLAQKSIDIPCHRYGSLEIREEKAYLNGIDARIACHTPDYAKEVFDLSQGQLVLPSVCACEDPMTVAKLTLDARLGGLNSSSNPLFTIEDPSISRLAQYPMRFSTPIVEPGIAESVMQLSWQTITYTTTMPWKVKEPGNLIFAAQNPQKSLWRYHNTPQRASMIEALMSDKTFIRSATNANPKDFLHWERAWESADTTHLQTRGPFFQSTTGSMILHIGYDGQNYFEGVLVEGEVDPGCRFQG